MSHRSDLDSNDWMDVYLNYDSSDSFSSGGKEEFSSISSIDNSASEIESCEEVTHREIEVITIPSSDESHGTSNDITIILSDSTSDSENFEDSKNHYIKKLKHHHKRR
jgi:hypothetical protein